MIKWIITSSALILMVMMFRAVVKNHIGPRLRYALWALVLARLLIPGTLGESPASVLNIAETRASYQVTSTLPDRVALYANGGVRSMSGGRDSFQAEPGDGELRNQYGWVVVADGQTAEALQKQGTRALDTAELKKLVDGKNLLLTVWKVGALAVGAALLAINCLFAVRLGRRRKPAGRYHGLAVYTAEGLTSPCLFGLLRPSIYIAPALAGDETAKAHILAHEYTHFCQGDHLWSVLRGVCAALHWYNPMVWWAAAASRRDCEVSCDAGAVRRLGEEHRAAYGRTLVALVTRGTTPADLLRCATTMTGSGPAVKERVALLVKQPRTAAAMLCAVAAVLCLAAACTFTGPAEPEQGEAAAPSDRAEDAQTPLAAPGLMEQSTPASRMESRKDVIFADGDPETSLGERLAGNLPVRGEDVPMPERLSTAAGQPLGDTILLAQLPEEDIFLYGDLSEETPGVLLRRGDRLQRIAGEHWAGLGELPRMYWGDLDGDGAEELAVIYCVGGAAREEEGRLIEKLVVYEWDPADGWTAYRHDPIEQAYDFLSQYTLVVDGEGSAAVRYEALEAAVDLEAMWSSLEPQEYTRPWWSCKDWGCKIQGTAVMYDSGEGRLTLQMPGILTAGGLDMAGYAFNCAWAISYRDGGVFAGEPVKLESLH